MLGLGLWGVGLSTLGSPTVVARQAPDGTPVTLAAGVFSEAQQARGERAYKTACEGCHMPDLGGGAQLNGDVPALVGPEFIGAWRGMSVGELFEWVRMSMPPTDAKKLEPQQYADILAYVFSKNRFPVGATDLAADVQVLGRIRIDGSAAAEAVPVPTRSVVDGVYTKAQSGRGEKAYAAACAKCHAASLAGSTAVPPLVGADFLRNWDGQTVADLFERIRRAMPPENPGGLSPEQYADIVAYILDKNTFRPGRSDLAGDLAELRLIWLKAAK